MNPPARRTGPVVTLVSFNDHVDRPLLVLGPALGAPVRPLWEVAASHLDNDFHVVGWDLPGHGSNNHRVPEQFSVRDLASALLTALSPVFAARNAGGGHLHYAGAGLGGVVGLQLALTIRERVDTLVLSGVGAETSRESLWVERTVVTGVPDRSALTVDVLGTVVGPRFLAEHQESANTLLQAFLDVDPDGITAGVAAMRTLDLRADLPRLIPPLLVVTGAEDRVTSPDAARELASDVPNGSTVSLDDVGHLAPVEDPAAMAHLIRQHAAPPENAAAATHLDREWELVLAAGGPAFESLASRQSPYELWTRPGLDDVTRHALMIGALATAGRLEELADQIRSAHRAGVGIGALGEILLVVATYGGMPAARRAAEVVSRTLFAEVAR